MASVLVVDGAAAHATARERAVRAGVATLSGVTMLAPFEVTRLNFVRLPVDEGLSAVDDIRVPSYRRARDDAYRPPTTRRTS